ncbi:MAG TPA: HAMP domain-containing histidine kinase, partial [Proteobacteria bacterium]|nr:HAMP domain-containing histidine kinase [Pseudomonadota bacterium]
MLFGNVPHKRQVLFSIALFFIAAFVLTVSDYLTARKTIIKESGEYAGKIANYLSGMLPIRSLPDTGDFLPRESLPAYGEKIQNVIFSFHLTNIKVYSLDGKILFSLDSEMIGKTAKNHQALDRALEGVESSHVATSSYYQQVYGRGLNHPLLETYIPIHERTTGKIIGAFEIYQDYRPMRSHVRKETLRSSIAHNILLVVFVLLFFGYGRTTSRTIENERIKMINDLEDRIEERTSELTVSKKKIDDLLERTGRMYRDLKIADEYQKNFIGLVSHELKTPLTVIKGYLALLEDGVLKPGHPDTMAALETSLDEVGNLESIVNNIIELSQLDQNDQQVFREEIDVKVLLDDAVSLVGKEIRNQGVEVLINLPPGAMVIHSDRMKVLQVLNQLVSNAVKFSPDAGRITITAVPGESGLLFSISDDGVGIPESQLKDIFNRFYQVDMTTTRNYEGTGLG